MRDDHADMFEPTTGALRSDSSDSAPTRIASRPTLTGDDERPTQIDRYRILELLGEGGMGSVYLAEQREPVRRKVALKLVKLGMDTKEVIARFDSERQALALMNHPNVAAVYDAGVTDRGRPYFVMEFVSGVPINRFCDDSCLPTRQRLELFMHVCDAVQHAHQKGIIHRDLKPSNILVMLQDGKPAPKVIDFGVAKATTSRLSDLTLHTQIGQIVGTPEYMSPEQAASSGLDVDTRTDVYSLGVVLYALLTGELPIDSKALRRSGPAEMQRMIRESQPARPSTRVADSASNTRRIVEARNEDLNTIRRHLRGDLDWIVMKALDKDRARRYASASELSADAGRWLRCEPVAAGPPSAVYRLRKFAARHRGSVAAGAALLLTLVGGLAVSTWQYWKAEAARVSELDQRRIAEERRVAAETARADAERERDRALAAETAAAKSAEEARAAAGRTDAVNRFMRTVLTAPDIRKSGHDVTVAEALDRASTEVIRSLADEPEIRCAVHMELGTTYFSLGRYERAIEQLEAARDLVERLYQGEHDEFPRLLAQLGAAHAQTDKPDKGLELCRQACDAAMSRFGPRHKDTLTVRSQLAQLLQAAGQHDKAEAEFRALLAAYRQLLGEDARETLVAMNCLGWSLQTQKRLEEAEPVYRECIGRAERAFGPDDPDTLIPLENLGMVLEAAGKRDEAERILRDGLTRMGRVFGEEHPDTISAMRNLATALGHAGKNVDAELIRRRVIDLTRRTVGECGKLVDDWEDYLTLRLRLANAGSAETEALAALGMARRAVGTDDRRTVSLASLTGQILAGNRKFDESVKVFEEFLPVARRVLGPQDKELLFFLNAFSLTLGDMGRTEQSESMQRELIETGTQLWGRDHRDVLIWRFNRAHSLARLGHVDEAERDFAELAELFAKVTGPDDLATAAAISSLANLLMERGELAEAAARYRAAYAIRSRELGATHRATIAMRARLALLLLYTGAIDDATRTARKVLVARCEALPDGDPDIAESLLILGECLTRGGELVEAEKTLREAQELRRARKPLVEDHVARSDAALAECLTAQQRYEEAEPLLLNAYDVMSRDKNDRLFTRLCVGRLIHLYESWQKPEMASEWREKPNTPVPAPTTRPAAANPPVAP